MNGWGGYSLTVRTDGGEKNWRRICCCLMIEVIAGLIY